MNDLNKLNPESTSFKMILPSEFKIPVDPSRTVEVKKDNKVVGFIKNIRQEESKYIADVVITDPNFWKEPPTISMSYETR